MNDSSNDSTWTRARVLTLLAAFLGWMFDGVEMGIFPLIARPALQEMQGGARLEEGFVQLWMGIVTACFLLGAAGGGLIFGWLGDRIGRVRAMSLSILCYSAFTGLCYFATEPWHLAAFRFIAALGMGGEWSLGVALVMEVWPTKYRPWLAGFIGAAANVGFVVVGVIAMIWPVSPDNWRWLMIVGAAPALLTFFIRLYVPESEAWKQAVAGKVVKPLREIFTPPILNRTILAMVLATVPLIVTWGVVQWLPLWADQLAGKGRPEVKANVHVASAIGAIMGCMFAPLLAFRIGRRPAYFVLCLLALSACFLLFNFIESYSMVYLLAAGMVGFFTASFYGWFPLYLPEIFPTRIRATAQGVSFNFGRIITAILAWNMGSIMGLFGESYPKAGMAVSLVYVFGMIIIWFAPETNGKQLPD